MSWSSGKEACYLPRTISPSEILQMEGTVFDGFYHGVRHQVPIPDEINKNRVGQQILGVIQKNFGAESFPLLTGSRALAYLLSSNGEITPEQGSEWWGPNWQEGRFKELGFPSGSDVDLWVGNESFGQIAQDFNVDARTARHNPNLRILKIVAGEIVFELWNFKDNFHPFARAIVYEPRLMIRGLVCVITPSCLKIVNCYSNDFRQGLSELFPSPRNDRELAAFMQLPPKWLDGHGWAAIFVALNKVAANEYYLSWGDKAREVAARSIRDGLQGVDEPDDGMQESIKRCFAKAFSRGSITQRWFEDTGLSRFVVYPKTGQDGWPIYH